MANRKRTRKWLFLGVAGFAGGLAALLVLRSIPMASGTAVGIVVAIIALKHLALAVAAGAPTLAFLKSFKPAIQAHCPWRPGRNG